MRIWVKPILTVLWTWDSRRYMALGKKTNQLMSFFGKQTVKRLVPLWLDSFKAAARSRFEKRRLEIGRPTCAQG